MKSWALTLGLGNYLMIQNKTVLSIPYGLRIRKLSQAICLIYFFLLCVCRDLRKCLWKYKITRWLLDFKYQDKEIKVTLGAYFNKWNVKLWPNTTPPKLICRLILSSQQMKLGGVHVASILAFPLLRNYNSLSLFQKYLVFLGNIHYTFKWKQAKHLWIWWYQFWRLKTRKVTETQ